MARAPLRIAIVNHGVFPFLMGGMERHTHFLAQHLALGGDAVDVLIPDLSPEQRATFDASEAAYRLLEFPWPQVRPWLRGNYLFSKAAAARLRATPYDAVYCQGFNGWAYLATTPKRDRAFTLYNPHGLEMFKTVGAWQTAKHWPMRWAAREQARLADRTVSLGGRLTDEVRRFLNVPDERIDVLPNAVDLAYIDSFPAAARQDGPPRFIFVGRLEYNKGVAYLCEAFKDMAGARLSIVGAGPLEAELRQSYAGQNIEFLGRLDDAALFNLYRGSDCFAFASLYEGMPTVILEAMACSLPVIATDIGAVRTMVDEANGFVAPPGSAQALRGAIEAFLKLPAEERRRMGRCSRQKVVERFTWERLAAATRDAIERGLARRTEGGA
ncbi:MAG TPA: glycosyltransferase family 4 protein [Caulobacteraceae bacterium]